MKTKFFAVFFLLVGISAWADEITYVDMKNSDYYNKAIVGSCFMTNYWTGSDKLTGHGWTGMDEGAALDPTVNYRVATSGYRLSTPIDASSDISTKTYTFPGKSLTMMNNTFLVDCSAIAYYGALIEIPQLAINGTVRLTGNVTYAVNRWDGTFTLAAEANLQLYVNRGDCYVPAKLISPESATLSALGVDRVKISNIYRWAAYGCDYFLSGNLEEHFATNAVASWGSHLYVNTGIIKGATTIGNASSLEIGANVDEVSIEGPVYGRDGKINIGAENSVYIQSIDMAFAEPSTYKQTQTGCTATNVYTDADWDDNYVPVNRFVSSKQSTVLVNTIVIGDSSALTVGTLNLDGSLVTMDNATLTVTNLVAANEVKVEMTGPCTIALAGSYSVAKPIEITIVDPGTMITHDLVTMPVSAGTLREADFHVNSCRYRTKVETRGDLQALVVENILPSVMDTTTGYVVLTNSDGDGSSSFVVASFDGVVTDKGKSLWFTVPGYWSDGCKPGSGKKYCVNNLKLRQSSETTFGGDQLVFVNGSTLRFVSASSLTVRDWILSGGSSIYTTSSAPTTKYCGKMTFLTTREKPFYFSPTVAKDSKHFTTDINCTIVGDEDAVVNFGWPGSNASGWEAANYAIVKFNCEASAYYGTLALRTNTVAEVTSNLTCATIEQYDMTQFKVTAAAGATVALGKYVVLGDDAVHTDWEKTVEVPSGNTLAAGSLALTGNLSKNGAGVLKVGGTATASDGAALAVNAGYIQPAAANAFNGIALAFADQAGFVVDASANAPLTTTAAVTVAGEVPVTIEGTGSLSDECTITLAKVPTANAAALLAALEVQRPRGFVASSPTLGTAEGGLTPITVTLTRQGLLMYVR